jgi:DNA-binding NarL/FixJ family response regulator
MHEESLFALRSIKAGANGYLMKQVGTHHLLHAVRELLEGNIYLSPEMQRRIAESFLGRTHSGRSAIANLSEREFAILHLIGLGLSTREIAERLSRSIKTIEAHRANIKEKLGLATGQELLRFAVQLLDAG